MKSEKKIYTTERISYAQYSYPPCDYFATGSLSAHIFGLSERKETGKQWRLAWAKRWTSDESVVITKLGTKSARGMKEKHIHTLSYACVHKVCFGAKAEEENMQKIIKHATHIIQKQFF